MLQLLYSVLAAFKLKEQELLAGLLGHLQRTGQHPCNQQGCAASHHINTSPPSPTNSQRAKKKKPSPEKIEALSKVGAANASVSASHAEVQAAGLPSLHAGSMQALCVDGLLAGLAGIKAWYVTEQLVYEHCLRWSGQAVAAWVSRQAKAAAGQHPLHNYPALEPHAALCKHRCCFTS